VATLPKNKEQIVRITGVINRAVPLIFAGNGPMLALQKQLRLNV